MEELFKVFDAWEPLYKARKAKGLSKWGRLVHIAEKLKGKQAKHITFTSAHPGRGGKKNLGSVEGNAHFLLGYGNPGFHLASYHWQVIYPELTDEEAEEFHAKNTHPSKPELWEKSGKKVKAEGDLEEGKPHSYAFSKLQEQEAEGKRMKAKSAYGSYTADPVSGLVHAKHNDHVYKWDLIKDSFFAADNPEIVEAMEKNKPEIKKALYLPEIIKHMTQEGVFDDDVYPIVKSLFPKPGSVAVLNISNERIYGIIKPTAIELYDAGGHPVSFTAYDREYPRLDLTKGGGIHPSLLYNFSVNYLGLDGEHLVSYTRSPEIPVEDSLPRAVIGNPSPGFEDTPSEYTEKVTKSVVKSNDNTFKVVIESE